MATSCTGLSTSVVCVAHFQSFKQLSVHRTPYIYRKSWANRTSEEKGVLWCNPPFRSPSLLGLSIKRQEFSPTCSRRDTSIQSRSTPPSRDDGVAKETYWGFNFDEQSVTEFGLNSDGSTWEIDSGEELGANGYRSRWVKMEGRSLDGSVKWEETWWAKGDWSGYKELAAEQSGRNAEGHRWIETWQESLYQDNLSNLARIERSAQKNVASKDENITWYEKWWERYDAKGLVDKEALKFGKLDKNVWWEQCGEHHDGRGFVKKWMDKWKELNHSARCGEKWESKFTDGIGSRVGETWHISLDGERWTKFWGEDYLGDGKVHKYGKTIDDINWQMATEESAFIPVEPHYGWADIIADCPLLLSIKPQEKLSI